MHVCVHFILGPIFSAAQTPSPDFPPPPETGRADPNAGPTPPPCARRSSPAGERTAPAAGATSCPGGRRPAAPALAARPRRPRAGPLRRPDPAPSWPEPQGRRAVRPSPGATAQRGRAGLFPPRRPPSTSFAALAAVRGPWPAPVLAAITLVGRCRRRAALDAVPARGAVGRVHEGTW